MALFLINVVAQVFKELSYEIGTDPDEIPVAGMLGRMAFVDEWCGYSQGGGTVTQATSKSTGVTLDRPCGQITTHNEALAAATAVSFTLTDSQIAPTDLILINHAAGGTTGAYLFGARASSGSAVITIRNVTGGSLSEALVLSFAVIKANTI